MSVYFTFIISLYRYLSAIDTPWKDILFDGWRKYAQLFVPSFIVAACFTSFSFVWGIDPNLCNVEYVFRLAEFSFYDLLQASVTLPFFLCTFVLFALAVRAINKRFGHALNTTATGARNVSDARRKRHISALKTLGIIIILLTFGTGPFLIVFLLKAFDIQITVGVNAMFGLGMILNSTLNPIIYTWKMIDLRKEVCYMFCRCCRD